MNETIIIITNFGRHVNNYSTIYLFISTHKFRHIAFKARVIGPVTFA